MSNDYGNHTSDPSSSHIHDMAAATAQVVDEHRQETIQLQRIVDHITSFVGWPGFVFSVVLLAAIWMALNLFAPSVGARPIDPPPFIWLQGTASIAALLVSALILTTQRRENQLATHRAQMILELSILNDQKVAKIIELLEEIRRDNPDLANRVDDQAMAMSRPSDAMAVLGAIKDSSEDAT